MDISNSSDWQNLVMEDTAQQTVGATAEVLVEAEELYPAYLY